MHRIRLLLFICLLTACQEDPVLSGSQTDLTQTAASVAPPGAAQSAASSPTAPPAPTAEPVLQAAISGLVKDANGQLLAQTEVRLDNLVTHTDAVGFYQFLNPPVGESKLIVQRSGYQTYTQTLRLDGDRRIVDVQLTAATASSAPIVLLPDGTASALPSTSPAATASPIAATSPTPGATSSADPAPTPSPAYDPQLDEAADSDVLLKRHANGLSLLFMLQKANGQPVNWEWGQITIQFVVTGSDGTPIANGVTVMNSFGDQFVASTSVTSLPNQAAVTYTLTLPDGRSLSGNLVREIF